jgi:hypothetical protein
MNEAIYGAKAGPIFFTITTIGFVINQLFQHFQSRFDYWRLFNAI